ncbi:MAG: hypothetical protein HFH87_18605 [Lachnospiraceae bacterium]|nr:hypothetical protein [Lachnospiraceae bacterium]
MTWTNEDLKALSDLLDEKLDKRLDPMGKKLDKIESRLDRLETDVAAVKKGLAEIRSEQIKMDRRISDIYNLTLDIWGQGVENRAWFERMTK